MAFLLDLLGVVFREVPAKYERDYRKNLKIKGQNSKI